MTARTTREIQCPECGAPKGRACKSVKSAKALSDDHTARRLISINEAAALGIERLRKPIWAGPMDHLKIDIIDGRPGPWLHLYSPFNRECNGRDPVDMIVGLPPVPAASLDSQEFERYNGPGKLNVEYQKAEMEFCGKLGANRQPA